MNLLSSYSYLVNHWFYYLILSFMVNHSWAARVLRISTTRTLNSFNEIWPSWLVSRRSRVFWTSSSVGGSTLVEAAIWAKQAASSFLSIYPESSVSDQWKHSWQLRQAWPGPEEGRYKLPFWASFKNTWSLIFYKI